MSIDDIVEKLKNGYQLRNHGVGFYLFPPYVPYKRQESEKVDDFIVAEMEQMGIGHIEIPHTTMIFVLDA